MVAPLLGMLVSSAAMRTAFGGSGTLASSLKMGIGYTTGAYASYGLWNEQFDPLGVQPKWDHRGGALKSKFPFRKRRRKMAFGYRRRFYRRSYSRYRRRRPYYRRRYY